MSFEAIFASKHALAPTTYAHRMPPNGSQQQHALGYRKCLKDAPRALCSKFPSLSSFQFDAVEACHGANDKQDRDFLSFVYRPGTWWGLHSTTTSAVN